jgi:hypothetical protein
MLLHTLWAMPVSPLHHAHYAVIRVMDNGPWLNEQKCPLTLSLLKLPCKDKRQTLSS